jgi:hypothetical protein
MAMAEALKQWIPDVIQTAECFYSTEDIRAGQRWGGEIRTELSETDFGVLCVTPENMKAPWLNFEAGALSKRLDDASRVVPVTLGFGPDRLDEPLRQFNGVEAHEVGIKKLVQSIVDVSGSTIDTERTFDRWWPDLAARINAIPALGEDVSLPEAPDPSELLTEILGIVRGIARDQRRDHRLGASLDLGEPSVLASVAVALAQESKMRKEPSLERLLEILDPIGTKRVPRSEHVPSPRDDARVHEAMLEAQIEAQAENGEL